MSLLLYTSGSTGAARGVMLSARNLRANAGAILGFLPLTPGDRALVTLPLYYCYGASVIHTHLRAGASVALSRAAFPEELCDELERSGATGLPAVPSLIKLLVDRSSIATRALPRLRYAMVSGGHLLDADVRKLRAALPDLALYIRYGVTELTAAASYLPPERLGDRLGSIGRGLPGAPLRVERDDGREVTPGADEVGEIVGAGPHVALGYYRTTDAAFHDGKFYTGDLARIDADGFIVVVGRAKEFVKTGGHRVSPVEVEGVLAELPGVLEVAVCGVPHPVRGEALVAGVVARPGHAPSAAELRAHCAARLPTFKVPVAFVLLPELPKTANGKISRRQLADALARGATNGDGPLFVPPSTA
jgi:acyl-CoA synthetase (AMP-forming)/AMP-acid ligase II